MIALRTGLPFWSRTVPLARPVWAPAGAAMQRTATAAVATD
jgi:hypothetical protein